jgi:MFS family permease
VETALLALLRQRNFSLLWFGQFISIIGDWVLFIALPFYTYSLTGSVLATGAMFMISTLPRLFLGSLAGTFVDRWDRKRTMIVADLLRVVTTLILLFVHSREGLWLIYLSAFLESIFSQFFYPAKSAIIPLLVDEKELLKANSLNGLSDALTRLLGSGLGGVLMGWLGFTSVVLLDAGSFLISALMLFFIFVPRRLDVEPLKTQSASVKGFMGMWRDWIAGLRLVRRERLLLVLFLVLGVALLGDSMISLLIVPLVKDLMGGGSQQLGWLMMAQGVGGLIGGLLVGQIGNRISPRRLAALGLVMTGTVIMAIISFPRSLLVLLFMLIAGIAASAWFISSETLLQLGVSDQFRGRIFGTLGTTSALASLVGMGLAGSFAALIGLVPILSISGSLYIVSGLMAWFMLPKPTQAQPNKPAIADQELPAQYVPGN